MRNFKKRTIALCLASAITVLGSFASDRYINSLMSLNINSGSNGKVNFTAFTKQPYRQALRIEEVGDNIFFITMLGTNSEMTELPSIEQFDNLESIRVETFPFTTDKDGYTKITVITKGNPTVNASTAVYLPPEQAESKSTKILSTTRHTTRPEENLPVKEQSSSYWDALENSSSNQKKNKYRK